jgi:Kef-type K+ transport system membrane component KefB
MTDHANYFLLWVVLIIVAAKVGERAARGLGLPQVLGELSMGMLLGNVYFLSGWGFFNFLREETLLKVLGELGALTLLLIVGLHTDLRALQKAGPSVLRVALGGLVAPAVLGYMACLFLIPDASIYTCFFIVAALCVNSVGIITRVFHEMGRLDTLEARIAIASTLIDAILVFLIIGAVSGIIRTGHFTATGVILTVGISVLFLALITATNLRYGEGLGDFVTEKFSESSKVFIVTVMFFSLAYLAKSIGLATILGAFGAGLLLQKVRLKDSEGKERSMEELVRPAYWVFVPIFFVLVGSEVRLESFLDRTAVLIGTGITIAAILGKLFCGLCVVERGVNRLQVGISMVPRAEMALVVASMGRALGVLTDSIYSAVIIMVMVTTLVAPPFLKRVICIPEKRHEEI